MSAYKTGRWSNEDIEEVKKMVDDGLTYEQMESRVNRPADTIKKQVENKMLMNISKDALITRQAELDIKKSSEWN